jgi:hypothetical protein
MFRSRFVVFTRHSPLTTRRSWLTVSAFALFFAGVLGGAADAQGLIIRLPKDGDWVRFEGNVKQVEFRPDAPEGDISMEWIQHLTIKSVGKEQALYHGKQVPCRWIEIKIVTGKPSESGVEAGPVGERIYKVLVPEERVIGGVADGDKIPFSFLDIVKGFRKMGSGPASPIPLAQGSEGAFQVYPLIGPLMHYDVIEAAGGAPEQVQVPRGGVKARKFKARRAIESPNVRTTNEAEFWQCDGDTIPFGLARWTTKTTIDKKDSAASRTTAFKPATQVSVDMSAHEWGTGAKSELATGP